MEELKTRLNRLKDEEVLFISYFMEAFKDYDTLTFTLELLDIISLPEWNLDLFQQCEDIGRLLGNTTRECLDILSCKKNKDFVYRELLFGDERYHLLKKIAWIYSELRRVLRYNNLELDSEGVDIRSEHLAELIHAI